MTDQPRRPHGYWVILAGATPTSFRARTRDVLVPTFVQLQRTQPDVTLKWFERGRIWSSPAEARDALLAQRQKPPRRDRPAGWRPGGDHQDPRKRFELTRDQKRARFKARQRFGPKAHGDERAGSDRPWRGGSPPSGRGPADSRDGRPGGRWKGRGGPKAGFRKSGPRGPRKPGGGSRGPR